MLQAGDDPIMTMSESQIIPELGTTEVAGVLALLGAGLAAADVTGPPAAAFAAALAAREGIGSTALGRGVAIPHCRVPGLRSARLALGRSREGVAFGAPDGVPVRLFVALAVPAEAPASHLRLLSEIARRLRVEGRVERLLAAATAPEMKAEFAQPQPAGSVR